MERIIYYPETLLQTSAVPSRTFTETGFLAGLISDGQEPEHRSSRDHLLPCSTPTCPPRCLSESARRPGNELPNSTTSSKFYRENPRNHIVQTLAFPLNSFYRVIQQGGKQGQVNSEVGRLCRFCSTGWWRAQRRARILGSVSTYA